MGIAGIGQRGISRQDDDHRFTGAQRSGRQRKHCRGVGVFADAVAGKIHRLPGNILDLHPVVAHTKSLGQVPVIGSHDLPDSEGTLRHHVRAKLAVSCIVVGIARRGIGTALHTDAVHHEGHICFRRTKFDLIHFTAHKGSEDQALAARRQRKAGMDLVILDRIAAGKINQHPLTAMKLAGRQLPFCGVGGIVRQIPAIQLHRICTGIPKLCPVRKISPGIGQLVLGCRHQFADDHTARFCTDILQKGIVALFVVSIAGRRQLTKTPLPILATGLRTAVHRQGFHQFHDTAIGILEDHILTAQPGEAEGSDIPGLHALTAIHQQIAMAGDHRTGGEIILVISHIVRQTVTGNVHGCIAAVIQLNPVTGHTANRLIAVICGGKLADLHSRNTGVIKILHTVHSFAVGSTGCNTAAEAPGSVFGADHRLIHIRSQSSHLVHDRAVGADQIKHFAACP